MMCTRVREFLYDVHHLVVRHFMVHHFMVRHLMVRHFMVRSAAPTAAPMPR